jgi:riboflavin synthase
VFTGIINHLGAVKNLARNSGHDLLITIQLKNKNLPSMQIGSSISCNGACLTLVKKTLNDDFFDLDFEASDETLNKTTIGEWKKGDKINIEFALKVGDELGGHFVSGHVDAVSKIKNIKKISGSHQFIFEIPQDLNRFICQKGSVVLNGISLTVNDVDDDSFSVNIIPHTFNNTNLQDLQTGDKVNLEIDLIARYLSQNKNSNG